MNPATPAMPQADISTGAAGGHGAFKRTLIVSTYPPGLHVGAAIILANLFRNYPNGKLFVMCAGYLRRITFQAGLQLPFRHYDLPLLSPSVRYVGRLFKLLNVLMLPYLLARLISVIRRERIEIIFAVPSTELVFCVYLARKLTGVPLYFYAMDDLDTALRGYGPGQSVLLKLISQKKILRASDKLWTICR